MNPRDLPVYQQRDRILAALTDSPVIVVESPTGSGKTTQLPLILHEAGYSGSGIIGITQPRRIAAVSVSQFLARQLQRSDRLVAYKMRFEDTTDVGTRIKIMTDGILLQEMKADYMLSHYSTIIVDEAHERSLNIDFILGLLKRVIEERPGFRVVISSATINAELFAQYFDSCPVVRIDAPMYPVTVIYDAPLSSSYEALLYKIGEIMLKTEEEQRPGDVLIFLSGEQMIKDCIALLHGLPIRRSLHILPLYSRLSREEQDLVFPPPPPGKRKVVVATNIAETSLTIDGITTVIDSGLAKMNYYNSRTFTSALEEGPVSRASANQRRGRAGRTRPGICYRLYQRDDFEHRPLFTLEEIYRTDLSEVVLRMAELGISEFTSFDFISSPGRGAIAGAVETLRSLDALSDDNGLSEIGRMMAVFPLIPRHSRMIVEAIRRYPEIIEEVLIATAFLSANTPFLLPQGEETAARKAHHQYRDDLGDFVSYLKLYQAYLSSDKREQFCERRYLDARTMAEIHNIKIQLEEIVAALGIPIVHGGNLSDYLCAVARGLIQFVCARTGRGQYRSLTAARIQIHPGSVMFRENPDYIVAGEIVRTSKMFARSVSPLQREWLARISAALAGDLTAGGRPETGRRTEAAAAGRPEKSRRDTTWQVQIGGRVFRLQPLKGKKKIALLPWREFAPVVRGLDFVPPPHLGGVRARLVTVHGELLSGSRIDEIFRIVRWIDPEQAHVDEWPRKRSFYAREELTQLCAALPLVLGVTRLKKSTPALGFLSLQNDDSGTYWFKPTRNFFTAVYESLASLEELTDELGERTARECVDSINRSYRRLNEIIEDQP
ncbi:MAG: ATP-dependent RNA helicase [Spirochaetaceae bacterium]|nr:MAG: ATP-dependent RNA helicase [Spirochaetaceae bacterium]